MGEAADGPSGISRATSLRPDVVLMDVDLPGLSGIEAAREIGNHLATSRTLLSSGAAARRRRTMRRIRARSAWSRIRLPAPTGPSGAPRLPGKRKDHAVKAAIYHGPHETLTIEDVEIDAPQGREVLVRTAASGVCHSDLHFIEGLHQFPAPAILGHEAAGVVEAVGPDVREFQQGDRVIACLSVFCGHCEFCTSGKPYLCRSDEVRRGPEENPKLSWDGKPVNQFANISSFAEQMLLYENALVKIRDDMPMQQAALIGCGVTTGVGAVLNTAKVEAGSSVAVIGAGGVGLSAIQGARIAGANQIIAVDTTEAKLGTARELGATHTIDASDGDPVAAIKDLSGGGADYAFEAIGLPETAAQAFEAVKRGGTATIVGMMPRGSTIELRGTSFMNEKTIQGSVMGSNRFRIDMPRYVEFYMQGKLKLDEMITKTGTLEDVNAAFESMRNREVARTVLTFD